MTTNFLLIFVSFGFVATRGSGKSSFQISFSVRKNFFFRFLFVHILFLSSSSSAVYYLPLKKKKGNNNNGKKNVSHYYEPIITYVKFLLSSNYITLFVTGAKKLLDCDS